MEKNDLVVSRACLVKESLSFYTLAFSSDQRDTLRMKMPGMIATCSLGAPCGCLILTHTLVRDMREETQNAQDMIAQLYLHCERTH